MKICFVLQAGFAPLGHTMACHLKEEMPEVQFCAFAQSRAALAALETQTDIDYGPIPLEEDMHHRLHAETLDWDFLRAFEAEYGIPNLWPYLYIDRIIMHGQYRREYPYDKPSLSYEDMLRRLQVTAKELSAFLDREKPRAVVFSVIGSVGSLLLYHMAKKRGIQTLMFKATRIGRGMTLTEEYSTLDAVQKRFVERRAGHMPPVPAAHAFIESFRERPAPYSAKSSPTHNNQTSRSTNLRFLKPRRLLPSAVWHAKTLLTQLWAPPRDYTDILIWWTVLDKCKRKLRGLVGYAKFYSALDVTMRFAYYPLHLEPETSLLLDSPYHTDQLEIIRAIAHALPIDMLLYVKEHPEMVGYRTRAFYREICKIPQVRLIEPWTLGFNIIRHASLVFTITGTAGFETALYKKPIITFTDVYFNDLSCVARCRSFEELPYLVKTQLEAPPIGDDELLHYISALIEESVEVYYGELWASGNLEEIKKDRGLRNLSAMLAQRLH